MKMLYANINNFFEEKLFNLNCQRDTKNYIVGIFAKYKNADFDLSQDSLTLRFSQARQNQDFFIYQNLGDWLFFIKSMFPEHLKNASENYYNNIAQLSYYNCYRIIRSWKVYEELADEYILLTRQIRNIFKNKLI